MILTVPEGIKEIKRKGIKNTTEINKRSQCQVTRRRKGKDPGRPMR